MVFDEAVGRTTVTEYDLISEFVNPNIILDLRWNGVLWQFVSHLIGGDVKTGAGPTYTHTMTYSENPAVAGITLAIEVNNAEIFENPAMKIQAISFELRDGFWSANITTLGSPVDTGSDATADATAFNNVTYTTTVERMRYKANQFRKNAQGGGALGSGDVLTDVFDLSFNLSMNYDPMEDVLRSASTGADKGRAEPIIAGHHEFVLGYTTKTADFTTHLDDLSAGTEYKSDLIMAETIGQAMTSTWEFNRMVSVDPQAALDQGLRIPMSHSYRLITANSTPTGMTNANPFHFVHVNTHNVDYDTNA